MKPVWVPDRADFFTIKEINGGKGLEIQFHRRGEPFDSLDMYPIKELPVMLSRGDVLSQMRDKPLADRIKQPRYQDSTGEDWIDQSYRELSWSEFCGAMKFTIGKYMRRLGKKDDEVAELEKVADYAERWVKKARQRIDEIV